MAGQTHISQIIWSIKAKHTEQGMAMRELSESQKRGLKRQQAILLNREREHYAPWRIFWQEKEALGEPGAPQRTSPAHPHCDTVVFFGSRIAAERKRQPKPVHISHIIKQLFQDANLTDDSEPSLVEVGVVREHDFSRRRYR